MAPAVVVDWEPFNKRVELPQLLFGTTGHVRVRRLYADAGYEAEWVHCWYRKQAGIESWIPVVVRRADGVVADKRRSKMARGLPKHYGLRRLAESFISGLKRVLGP